VTAVYAVQQGWTAEVPGLAVWGGARGRAGDRRGGGALPALRAARLAPTEALRTV